MARLGGDEFLVLLPEVSRVEYALGVAQKIVDVLGRPFAVGGRDVRVTLSVGLAIYPDDGLDGDALVKSADLAMYKAKDRGRNTYEPRVLSVGVERPVQEPGVEHFDEVLAGLARDERARELGGRLDLGRRRPALNVPLAAVVRRDGLADVGIEEPDEVAEVPGPQPDVEVRVGQAPLGERLAHLCLSDPLGG